MDDIFHQQFVPVETSDSLQLAYLQVYGFLFSELSSCYQSEESETGRP
jgi:hypothetical protein